VADSPGIFVLSLEKVGANAKVLTHFMKCVMCSPFSEPKLVFPKVWLLKRHPELVGRRKVEWNILRFVGYDAIWLSLCISLSSDTRFRHGLLLELNPIRDAAA